MWLKTSFLLVVVGCGEVKPETPLDAAVDAPPDVLTIDAPICPVRPNATFTYAPMPVGVGVVATFTPQPGLQYAWTFAGAVPASSTVEVPQAVWMAAGPHDVTLSVTDPATTCTASTMQTIQVAACSAPINSPAFSQNTGGHPNSGIVIVPSINTTLTQFTVINQGLADTALLTDAAGTPLQSIAIPAATTTFVADVTWPLVAGTTYHLVTADPSNNRYAPGVVYPIGSSSLQVTAGWMDNAAQTMYWFGYTALRTCP